MLSHQNIRSHRLRRAVAALLVLALLGALSSSSAAQQPNPPGPPIEPPGKAISFDARQIRETLAFWTPERMRGATPIGLPVVESSAGALTGPTEPPGPPGFVNGQPPQRQYQEADDLALGAGGDSPSTVEVEPLHGSYPAPYSRWTGFGKFTNFPNSTVAKMFFTQNGGNFVCSASTVNRDHVLTAGHCVHAGNNSSTGWSTNVLFCPSYNASGVNPQRGCWAASILATSGEWFANRNFDRDWGGARTAATGSVHSTSIGNVTGWLGRAWNWQNEAVLALGYPAGAPFNGNQIIRCASSHWYSVSWGAGADSKYIGCDMTGGSSGGPWIYKFGRPGQAGGQALNWADGVNSHRRIVSGSTLVHEMGGPPFTTEAGGSEDFFAFLFSL